MLKQDERRIQVRNTKLELLLSETLVAGFPKFILFRVDIFFGERSPKWARVFSFARFLDHTQRCTTLGRTPLDE